MKKDLVDIFNDSMKAAKRNIYVLSSCLLIFMIVSGVWSFETRKSELVKFVKYNLSYDQILPSEEIKFIKGLKNATQDFSFLIIPPESNRMAIEIVCSRNNCFHLNFSNLALNISQPIAFTVVIIGVLLLFLNLFQKMKMLPFLKEIGLLQDILEEKDVNLGQIKSHELIVLLKSFKENKTLESEKLVVNLKSDINRQIAHDIRSPLEALKSVTEHLTGADNTTKYIINNSIGRITGIANELLKSTKTTTKEFENGNFRLLLDDIINDKKYEHNIRIHSKFLVEYKDCFVSGNENDLYRAISNIVNNAYEAQDPADVRIEIELTKKDMFLYLSIRDFGKGIPANLISKIALGGVTTKENGNGLGVSSSKKMLEDHNGSLQIKSDEGVGTEVIVSLPVISSPIWFSDTLCVESDTTQVICVDDDPSFLELYREKLKHLPITIETFTDKKIDEVVFKPNSKYFFDFDLGKKKSGLDYIISKGIGKYSTLVTSMYQDLKIQELCVEHGVKILPKQIFNNAKVKYSKDLLQRTSEGEESIVFIDDDYLMHMSWSMEAKKQGVSIDCFFTIEEFLVECEKYNRKTKIYVDSNLKGGIKGEIESEKIYSKGFEQIYLATGYSPSDFDKPAWIKEIVGKRADFGS